MSLASIKMPQQLLTLNSYKTSEILRVSTLYMESWITQRPLEGPVYWEPTFYSHHVTSEPSPWGRKWSQNWQVSAVNLLCFVIIHVKVTILQISSHACNGSIYMHPVLSYSLIEGCMEHDGHCLNLLGFQSLILTDTH